MNIYIYILFKTTVIFQIIADCDHLILHVNAASPGSSNDIYVMNGSEIKHLGERNDFQGYYMLGDSGYVFILFTRNYFFIIFILYLVLLHILLKRIFDISIPYYNNIIPRIAAHVKLLTYFYSSDTFSLTMSSFR